MTYLFYESWAILINLTKVHSIKFSLYSLDGICSYHLNFDNNYINMYVYGNGGMYGNP